MQCLLVISKYTSINRASIYRFSSDLLGMITFSEILNDFISRQKSWRLIYQMGARLFFGESKSIRSTTGISRFDFVNVTSIISVQYKFNSSTCLVKSNNPFGFADCQKSWVTEVFGRGIIHPTAEYAFHSFTVALWHQIKLSLSWVIALLP